MGVDSSLLRRHFLFPHTIKVCPWTLDREPRILPTIHEIAVRKVFSGSEMGSARDPESRRNITGLSDVDSY